MRAIICLLLIVGGFGAIAQTKIRSRNIPNYIGSSAAKGRSDAVIVDNVALVHTKQTLPFDKNGAITGKNSLATQIDQVFKNIAKTLNESGSKTNQIVKLNIFVKTTVLMPEVQSLISNKFHPLKQPSITLVAGELTHPDALISIDAIAVSKYKGDQVKLSRSRADQESSSAILPAGPVVYVSGQAAQGGIEEATKGTLMQLQETLIGLGLSIKDAVQIKTFLTPMSSLSIVRKEFDYFFKGEVMPPLVFVEWVSNDPVIEIELIASSLKKNDKAFQVEYITPPGMSASPVYSKVSRLNYGKKVYLSGIFGASFGSTESEVKSVFSAMENVLSASGSSFEKLLKATYYVGNDRYTKSLADLRLKYYNPKMPPAASKAMLKEVGLNGAGISVDMISTIKE